jgi:UDP-N-acetylglucosamine--N-acetylmuramyl-(pentapeptide) pyrophosphoryl-undecaprenol N-acetylglucosamine transferase
MKKIALTGGGTGGHIYPCLSVAEELFYREDKGFELYYFGHPEKLEAKLLSSKELKDSRANPYSDYISFIGIEAEPLIRSWNPLAIFAWIRRFYSYKSRAVKLLQDKQIDLVFGTGGYVAGPVFAACKALKIPYIIHNLDAHMGLANMFFVGDAYALTLGISELGIKPKTERVFVTGNPISKKFFEAQEENSKPTNNKLKLLVTGGSQGAESINNAIGNLLPELDGLNLELVIVTGTKTYQDFCTRYEVEKYSFVTVKDYVHNMPELCHWADLAICRAGAMTIAEMVASDTVCIFVPLPWAAHDHQNKNAAALVASSAAMSLDQNASGFETQLFYLIQGFSNNDKTRLDYFLDAMQGFKNPDSAKNISRIIQDALFINE